MLLRSRSYEKEYLDADNINPRDLYLNLSELDVINRWLGGYRASLKGLADILKIRKEITHVLDIGFGGGDAIKQFSLFATKLNLKLFFYGVDLKSDCVKYAEENLLAIRNKELMCEDYRNISFELLNKIDIIHCSLFLHHLRDDEIIALFKFCKSTNSVILINDLHRHWIAYSAIKLITFLFSKSYLVKNDAPLSVKRGFKKAELIALLNKSGLTDYRLKWTWAFRYRLIIYT